MTTHKINPDLLVQKYEDIEGVSEKVQRFEGRVIVLNAHNGSTGYGFIYCPPDGKCRRTHQGPIEDGPYVGFYGLATVIALDGGTSREKEEEAAQDRIIYAHAGERIQLPCGSEFSLELDRSGDVIAVRVPSLNEILSDVLAAARKAIRQLPVEGRVSQMVMAKLFAVESVEAVVNKYREK